MEILDLKFGGISVGVLLAVGWMIWFGNRVFNQWSEDRAFRKEIDDMHRRQDAAKLKDGDYLRAMAFHEAGHAVVAWLLRLTVGNIHVRKMGEGNGGTQIGCADHLPLVDQLAALAAGKEAEQVFNSHLPVDAGANDRLMAVNLVLKLHEGLSSDEIQSHLKAGHARARDLLVEHEDSVTRLAERLVEVHQVGAAEFLRLMNV